MGTNVNRERKLQPHQRPIWRKAFEASMQHTSIEAAEKKAWQAVDIWERVGAFNESTSAELLPDTQTSPDYKSAFEWIREWFNEMSSTVVLGGDQTLKLWEATCDFERGVLTVEGFRDALHAISPFVD